MTALPDMEPLEGASVLVTGGAGKLGRHVMAELAAARPGWAVTVLEHPDADVSAVPARVRVVAVDLVCADEVRRAVAGHDVVLHLGGIPRPGLVGDEETFRTNVMGTFHVCAASRAGGVRRVVVSSSTAVIGTDWGRRDRPPERLPIDETHPCRPEDVYGLSKLVAEEVASTASRAGGPSTVVLRPPWLLDDDDVTALAASGGAAPRGAHTYAYVDVRDAATAFRLAAEAPITGCETLFVAAPDSTLDRPLGVAYDDLGLGDVPGLSDRGATDSALSSARAAAVLGWIPSRSWRRAGEAQMR